MGIVSAMMQVGAAIKHAVAALFKVTHSLRFDGSGNYLVNTLTTTGNRKTFTYSCWVKRSTQDRYDYLFTSTTSTTTEATLRIGTDASTDNLLGFYQWSGSFAWKVKTTSTITDTEWHHVVLAVDTNQTTDADKVKIYLDGSLTTHDGASTYMATGADTNVNLSGNDHGVGGEASWGDMGGQLAEVHFIDGTAYDASYFGETRNSQWVPKKVTGVTYGTNGFYLPFDRREEGVTLLLDGSSPTNDISSNDQDASLSFKGTAFSASTRTGPGSQGTRDVIDLNGSNQFIVSSYYTSNLYSQDFTIEGWYDIDVLSGTHTFWAHRNDAASGVIEKEGVQAYCNSSAYGFVVGNTSSWLINAAGGTPSTGWHHIALTRSGNDYTLYVDGVSTVSASSSGTVVASGGLSIGSGADTTAGTQWLDGAVMDFRVTEGIARDIAADWTAGVYTSPITNDIEYGSLGRDASTNGNNFTVPANTITPDDQLLDSPNLRFATWDTASVDVTLSEGNLKTTHGANDEAIASESSALVGGKFYCELYWESGTYLMPQVRAAPSASAYSGYFSADGNKYGVGSGSYGSPYSTGAIIGCAVDATTSKVWWRLDGTWQANGDPASGTNPATSSGFTGNPPPPLFFALSDGTTANTTDTSIANFGQDHTFAGSLAPLASPHSDEDGNGEFYYQPPPGFKALATSY